MNKKWRTKRNKNEKKKEISNGKEVIYMAEGKVKCKGKTEERKAKGYEKIEA